MKILTPSDFTKKNDVIYPKEILDMMEQYRIYINGQWEKEMKKSLQLVKKIIEEESVYMTVDEVKYYHEKWIAKLIKILYL